MLLLLHQTNLSLYLKRAVQYVRPKTAGNVEIVASESKTRTSVAHETSKT